MTTNDHLPDCRTCAKFTRKGECSSSGVCSAEFFMYEPLPVIRLYESKAGDHDA
jgi:hypothetical protein